MVKMYNWDDDVELLYDARKEVKEHYHPWRPTSTGLLRSDERYPAAHKLANKIEAECGAEISSYWTMKQPPGSPGALMHTHNQWDTYIYYPYWSDAHLVGKDFDIMPKPGLLVYLPGGTEHGVEDNYGEEHDRYSIVFLAYPKEEGKDDADTQGSEA